MSADRGSESASAGNAPRGMLNSLRSIGPALIGLLRTRLELLGIELADEKERAARMAMLGALALLFAGLALLMVNVLVLAWFWDSHRYLAIIGLVVAYGGMALLCVMRLQTAVASRPPMFEATLAELKADVEALNRVRQD
jgi:uncharacterized membrane protein YqjE